MAFIPTKLRYNPLSKLDSILWLKVDKTNKTFIDCGSLRNYTTVSKGSGTWSLYTPEEISNDATYNDNIWLLKGSNINIYYTNTNNLFMYLNDLFLYYTLYITTDGYLEKVPKSVFSNSTPTYSGIWLFIWNIIKLRYGFGDLDFFAQFDSYSGNTFYKFNQHISVSNLSSSSSVTDKHVLTMSRVSLRLNNYVSYLLPTMNYSFTPSDTTSRLAANKFPLKSFQISIFSNTIYNAGIGQLVISPKATSFSHWNYDISTKHTAYTQVNIKNDYQVFVF